ncbi:MAG: hypothetical protein ACTSPI_11600 [Candidatus Heimdallarchaeaceae archaeon]
MVKKETGKDNFSNASATLLVKTLGYKEIFSGKYGIDMLAQIPSGAPIESFLRPCCSPVGKTAFEFTSQIDIKESIIDELSEKIKYLNNQKNLNISGGIILCDIKAHDKLYRKAEQKKNIFIWDIRDTTFLSAKILLARFFTKFGNTIEKQLDTTTTYLQCLERTSKGKNYRAKVGIFFHHPIKEISSGDLSSALDTLTKTIVNEARPIGILPLEIDLQIHTRSYPTRDVYSKIDEILEKHNQQNVIVYTLPNIVTYYLAPWNGGLLIGRK